MSVAEETLKEQAGSFSKPKTVPLLNRVLDFLSSVKFGVVLLCVLVAFALVGMLIVQQNVNGFDAYFGSLTPAEKMVYGTLGLFDIYHSWYFNFLLLVLSLNIVLASIDRFPSAWSFIKSPKLDASRKWLAGQKQSAVIEIPGGGEEKVAARVAAVFKKQGLSAKITEKKGKFFVFGESGRFNRLGAYIVHVFLLTLFLGHFVALQTGFDADVRMVPGEKTSEIKLIEFNLDKQERFAVGLPFTIECTDIQQKLIDPNGSIEINNTLDWHTRIKITDPQYGETVADVSLNRPFEYRGYRFFQASAITVGAARTMTLELTPQNGGEPLEVDVMRNGSTTLPDGTKIDYQAFFPDFVLSQGKPDTRSAEYNNPAAILSVTASGGEKKTAYAFGNKLPPNVPIGAPVAGYKWRLKSFEKSPLAHVLSIKYDPFNAAFVAWYIGGFGLIGALCFVFFVSHRRVWAMIDEAKNNGYEVVLGGNTNRSQPAFEDKFRRIAENLEPNQTNQTD
ncbi:MAG: cytochrome c biogenesis protein ResB [Acidobacteriota bacterium]|nr:cytochrome c biogenesis protein ResB [Acidobacteriota bacterium]